MIANKLKASGYSNLKDLEIDFLQMIDNAKVFNHPKSFIYKDATKLRKAILDSFKTLNKHVQDGKPHESDPVDRKIKKKLVDQLASMTKKEFDKRLTEAESIYHSATKETNVEQNLQSAKEEIPPKKEHISPSK